MAVIWYTELNCQIRPVQELNTLLYHCTWKSLRGFYVHYVRLGDFQIDISANVKLYHGFISRSVEKGEPLDPPKWLQQLTKTYSSKNLNPLLNSDF